MDSRDSAVDTAIDYRLNGRRFRVRVPVGARLFFTPRRPNLFWGPLNFLSNGYRELFPLG
jgi:hypothetical protein